MSGYIYKKDDERDISGHTHIHTSEYTTCERLLRVLDTVSVEPLRRATEVPIIIDDGVTRVIDEPSCTTAVKEKFLLGYSSKPNREFVSLVP